MNVIVIVIDTLRQDHIGAYGNKWIKTPNLDRLASESAVFTRSASDALPTIPHRRSVHTGMRTFPYTKSYYAEERGLDVAKLQLGPGARVPDTGPGLRGGYFMGLTGVLLPGWEPIPSDQVTMAELLHVYGYDTAFITDSSPYWTRPRSLVDMNFTRGFRHWDLVRGHEYEGEVPTPESLARSPRKKYLKDNILLPGDTGGWEHALLERELALSDKWRTEDDYISSQVFLRANEWLDENLFQEKPFLLFVDCFEPHEPFIVPKRYVDIYDAPDYDGKEPLEPRYGVIDYLTERELWRMRALYAGDTTFVDEYLGRFLDKLRGLGLLENSLVCLTADHGFSLGEHGVTGKLSSHMWRDLHDVPFMIRHPEGLGAGQRFDAFVQGQDLFPTILSFLGHPPPYEMDGFDLWPVIRGERQKVRDHITAGFGLHVRSMDDDYSFIATADGLEPELRDLRNDPRESVNIAKDNPRIVQRMWEHVMEDVNHQPILADWEKHAGPYPRRLSISEERVPPGVPLAMDKFY